MTFAANAVSGRAPATAHRTSQCAAPRSSAAYMCRYVALAFLCVASATASASASAAGDAGVPSPGQQQQAAWRRLPPSMPADVAQRHRHAPPPLATRPRGPRQPFDASYAHRQGDFELQLPEGATNLQLQLARHEDFVWGSAFMPEAVPAEHREWYVNMTRAMFTGMTPENAFKWPEYERVPGSTQAGRERVQRGYVNFGREAHLDLMRGHTLEWYKVGPFWPHKLSCDGYAAALRERVTREVTTFKGAFHQYDVFNEIIESPGMLDKCGLWDTALPDAFKLAAAADPDAKLCLNDLSLIEAHNSPRLIEIVQKHLRAHGAPIHCIGIQAHFEEYGVNTTYQTEKLDLLAGLGLDLYITEFSLFSTWLGPDGEPTSYLDEDTQAETTVDLFRTWFSHPAVKGVVLWGWFDGMIWARNAGLWRADRTPKKAALAVQDLWQREFSTRLELADPGPTVQLHGFFGTYDYAFVGADGRQHSGSVLLGRKQRRTSMMLHP